MDIAINVVRGVIDHLMRVGFHDGPSPSVRNANTLENLWSLLKRSISGVYVSVESWLPHGGDPTLPFLRSRLPY